MDTNQIVENSNNITLENVGDVKSEFCKIWPNARPALEYLQKLIKNPVAKVAVGIVIDAGDAVSKSICGQND